MGKLFLDKKRDSLSGLFADWCMEKGGLVTAHCNYPTSRPAVGSRAATEALIDTSECVGPRNGRKMTAAFIITTWPAPVYINI